MGNNGTRQGASLHEPRGQKFRNFTGHLQLVHTLVTPNVSYTFTNISYFTKILSETNKERERNMEGFSLYFMFICPMFNEV